MPIRRFYIDESAGEQPRNTIQIAPCNGACHDGSRTTKGWLGHNIPDDPARTLGPSIGELNPGGKSAQSNKKGYVAFTQSGANRRSTQAVIHLDDNSTLDSQMTPFGQVVSGMKVVEKLYSGYGEPAPTGKGPMLTPSAASPFRARFR